MEPALFSTSNTLVRPSKISEHWQPPRDGQMAVEISTLPAYAGFACQAELCYVLMVHLQVLKSLTH